MALVATAAALAGAGFGVRLRNASRSARGLIPFAGGLLLGVAVFGLFPELAAGLGWPRGTALFIAGYLVLFGVNRFLFPVCPSCSHDHDHSACHASLHGFALPLILAAAVHSALDGWSIVTAEGSGLPGVRLALPVAVVLHKIPEGIALGAILRAAVTSPVSAFAWCVLAEGATLAGAASGLAMAPHLGQAWVFYPLAIAGGFFFYLGFHAVHGEWKRRGDVSAFTPALAGAAGAAALQQAVRVLLP